MVHGQNRRVKALSCGILVLDPTGRLLLCRATGSFRWDIPKGGGEAGETPLQTPPSASIPGTRSAASTCGSGVCESRNAARSWAASQA